MVLVAVAATVVWFMLLGYRDLVEPDEGRYAEIPREMVASGDWLTPRLNGFKYFEKPVLQYWATAVGYTLFGESNTTARLWPALIGFLGALWAGFLGYRLHGRIAGFYASIIALSSLLYVVMGHVLTLDMAVSVFLAVGIGSLTLAQSQREDPGHVRRWMLAGWAALALATLTKGLIGLVLPAVTVALYSLWQRDWRLWKQLHLGKGLLLFLILAAPWFVAVSLANPEFARFFFIHEHFERYTTTVHHREGSLWYFIPIFLLGAFPWVAVMLDSLIRPAFPWRPVTGAGFDGERFLSLFAVVVFVFFSAGHSKLPAYILPMLPVLAVVAGKRLVEAGYRRVDAWLLAAMSVVLLIAGWRAAAVASTGIPAEIGLAYRPWIMASAVLLAAAAAVAFSVSRARPGPMAAIGLMALAAFQTLSWGFQCVAISRSSHDLAAAIRATVPAGTEVFAVDGYPQSLPFYLRHTLTLVTVKGEMAMGIDQEPERWIGSPEEFLRHWANREPAVAVFDQSVFGKYRGLLVPMRVIHDGPRGIAVVKQ